MSAIGMDTALPAPPLNGAGPLVQRVIMRVRADSAIYLVIALYTIAGLACLRIAGAGELAAYSIYVSRSLIMFGFLMPATALVLDFLWTMLRYRRHRGLVYRQLFSAKRLAHILAGLLLMQAMILFFGTFTSLKNALPLIHGGFPYDRLHADIDAALHLGTDPWRLIQPFWGTHAMRRIVEWNYNALWFIACYGILFFVVTSPRAAGMRIPYMMGFMALWILVGNVMAGAFLSAGPAFYGHVTGDHLRFAGQAAFLAAGRDVPFSAAFLQNYLWAVHESGRAGLGSGISAFPSMHIALVAYNAFVVAAWSRRAGVLAFAYVAFVGLSSVYLGWHYAIDGYVSVAVAGLVYLAARSRIARRGAVRAS